MSGGWSSYPYFWLSLFFLSISFLVLRGDRYRRCLCLLSGLLSAPYGVLSVVYVPEYWDPVRIITFFKTGPEDLAFSFANGVIVWQIASLPVRSRLDFSVDLRHLALGYVAVSGFGIGVVVLFWFLGLGIMASTMVGFGVTAVILFLLRPDLWLLALTGGFGFLAYYFIAIRFVFSFWPSFASQWNSQNLWGPTVGGVPADELAWAFGYGFTWPLWMGWLFRCQIVGQPTSEIEPVSHSTDSSAESGW